MEGEVCRLSRLSVVGVCSGRGDIKTCFVIDRQAARVDRQTANKDTVLTYARLMGHSL